MHLKSKILWGEMSYSQAPENVPGAVYDSLKHIIFWISSSLSGTSECTLDSLKSNSERV